ncbi:hypothetical protein chiPu_0007772 [Chiloscyllium punctatum]|uniref:Dedicator of cytokinesis C/D N-terminal domain-containing protein n=1 Tax=Chiloscyllium punctatum TaxID=137246 RepID=A0A401SFX9_CHIPU|nr:hypothetical protein [Chiloscyllium punctatum]
MLSNCTFLLEELFVCLFYSEAATGELKPFVPHFRRTSLTDVQEFSPSAVPSCDIPFSPDPVDPLDFEVHIANQMENSELGSLANLVDFPKDDIEVTLSPRAYRTVNPAVPDDWNNLSPQVRSCVKTYTKNWLTITRRYQKCSIGSRRKGLNLPHQVFECDESFNMEKQNFLNAVAAQADELETEAPDIFIQNLLQPTDQEEVDRKNEIMRKSGRLLDLFTLFPPSDEDEAMHHRTIPPLPCEQFEQRLQINFLEFKFIGSQVEKVLQQGSITDCAEPYMTIKENETAKTKEKVGKLRFQANSFCQRLSLYRMPFAWAAVDLMSLTFNRSSQNSLNRESFNGGSGSEMRSRSLDNRNHIPQFGPVQHSLNMFNKQEEDKLSDEDLMKFITDEKKPSPLLRRLRKIPGIFRFELSTVKDTPSFCFTPDFLELKSSNSGDTELALEVLEFPLPGVLTPYTIYR